MRNAYLVLIVGCIAAAACTTSPQRVQRRIYSIVTPDRVAPGDSIRISFLDDTGPCDAGPRVDAHEASDTLRIAVSSIPKDDGCLHEPLIAGVVIQMPYVYWSPPPHLRDLTILFAEPEGGDVVRHVTVQ